MVNQKGKMNKIVEIKIKKMKNINKQGKKQSNEQKPEGLYCYLFIYYMIGGRKEGRSLF